MLTGDEALTGMRGSSIPWLLLLVALIGSAALFDKLHEVRTRLSVEQTQRMAERDQRFVEFHLKMREDEISRATLAANHPIVVIGDSLTEQSQFPPDICGHPVVNAGIGGIGISRALPLAEQIAQQHVTPTAIVIAVGINDATRTVWARGLHAETFKLAYRAAITAALESTPNVMIANAAPVDFSGSEGASFDPEGRAAIDDIISDTAAEFPVKLIDLSIVVAKAGPLHLDGVHFSNAGKEAWMNAVASNIAGGLGCGPALLSTDATLHSN